MRFTQFSEIHELSDGSVIEGIKGTVTKVLKYRTGEGDYGPYSYQTIQLSSGDLKIDVDVANKENLIQFNGKFVCLLSGNDGKGKVSGLTVVDKEYNGKISRIIKANKLMEITETVAPGQLETPPAKQETPTTQPVSTAKPGPKARVAQRTHVMKHCRKAVWAMMVAINKEDPTHPILEESVNSMTCTIFISLFTREEREWYGDISREVTGQFIHETKPAAKPSSPPKPAPAPEADNDYDPGF